LRKLAGIFFFMQTPSDYRTFRPLREQWQILGVELNRSESAGAAPQVLLTARGHRCRLLSVKGGNTGYAVNDHPRDANGGIENNPDCGDPDATFNGVRFLQLVLR
jgi:hypothetical protein